MEQIELFYPKGERGRPPIGCEKRLRLYLMFEELNLRLKRQGILMCEGTRRNHNLAAQTKRVVQESEQNATL